MPRPPHGRQGNVPFHVRRWLQQVEQPIELRDNYGKLIGTFIPAGQEPPTSPPEPPAAAAFVPNRPRPGQGGPGAAIAEQLARVETEGPIPQEVWDEAARLRGHSE